MDNQFKYKLLKEWHEIALANENVDLYFFNKRNGQWCGIDEDEEVIEEGIISNYNDDVNVDLCDGHSEQIYYRITQFISFEEITAFRLCRKQPRPGEEQITMLSNILGEK